MKEELFTFLGEDGKEVAAARWLPKKAAKGVVQLSHGMMEHSLRYREWAERLCGAGYCLYINDHRGHGRTAKESSYTGFIASKRGWHLLLSDTHQLNNFVKREHPKRPLFLMGHSMGSFIARSYLRFYPQEWAGIILSGTTSVSPPLSLLLQGVAHFINVTRGEQHRSAFLDWLIFDSARKSVREAVWPAEWLTKEKQIVSLYESDPFCGFICTASLYRDLGRLLSIIEQRTSYQAGRGKSFYMVAGCRDPLGHYGRAPHHVYKKYKQAGVKDITLRLVPAGRHECLNETNRDEICKDIIEWIEKKT